MVRLQPYRTKDGLSILNWVQNEEDFTKWCANKFCYPISDSKFNQCILERENMGQEIYMSALDEQGCVIGFLCMDQINYQQDTGNLSCVIVDPEKRSRGIGKQMIKLAIQFAFIPLGLDRVTASVFDIDPVLRTCFHKAGFWDDCYNLESFDFRGNKWGSYQMSCRKMIQKN